MGYFTVSMVTRLSKVCQVLFHGKMEGFFPGRGRPHQDYVNPMLGVLVFRSQPATVTTVKADGIAGEQPAHQPSHVDPAGPQ